MYRAWRQRCVEAVVSSGGDVPLRGGPVAPGEVWAAPSLPGSDGLAACLLD
jgi:hypothetical protein